MAAPLTVHNAEIKTASVEVRTLTISGKQVTLAVFRQLREEPLIAEDGTLNGVPWGVVNYHPDRCGPAADVADHLHIVWQQGTELLRSWVDAQPQFKRFWSQPGSWLLSAHLRDLLLGRPSRFWDGKAPEVDLYAGQSAVLLPTIKGALFGIRPSLNAAGAFDALKNEQLLRDVAHTSRLFALGVNGGRSFYGFDEAAPIVASQIEEAVKAIDAEIGPRDRSDAAERMFVKHQASMEEEVQRQKRHRDLRVAIGDLPQLFIAV